MCRFTHPLAAIGTMSWPLFEVPGPRRSSSASLSGPLWNHPMAETASSEAFVGQDCGMVPSVGQDKTID
jgi:hypothetical protein